MIADPAQLPNDVDALKRMIVAMAQDAVHARTLIEKLRFELARLKRQQFGTSSEKLDGRVEQLELAIEALETDRAERSTDNEAPVSEPLDEVGPKPARRALPDHLPREEVIHPGPCACPSCGGKLRRIGSDVTETLDYVPGRFKVIRHVREAFSCGACETVVQAPAPFHAIARGRAGPGLLAHIMVAKFDDHLPLYRQAEIYAREGVALETSTLSGWVGATAAALMPLVDLLRCDVVAGSAIRAYCFGGGETRSRRPAPRAKQARTPGLRSRTGWLAEGCPRRRPSSRSPCLGPSVHPSLRRLSA